MDADTSTAIEQRLYLEALQPSVETPPSLTSLPDLWNTGINLQPSGWVNPTGGSIAALES